MFASGLLSLCQLGYRSLGALLRAQAAAHAFILIYMGQEIIHGNGLLGAFLGTQGAAYTTCLAYLHHKRPLILIHAVNRISGLIWDKLDKVLGTGIDTLAAGPALILIYQRNSVYDPNGIKFAGCHTGTETHTAEIA